MAMSKIVGAILFIGFLSPAFSDQKPVTIPSYQILLDSQFSCSNKPSQNYKFVHPFPKEPFTEVAQKVWGVVKDSELIERPNQGSDTRQCRSFTWSYTKMGFFRCGQPAKELSLNGVHWRELPVVVEAYKKPGFLDLRGDEPSQESEDHKIIRYDLVRDGPDDGPAIPGRVGMPCLVKLEDVLKDFKKIDLNLLCKGESAAARKITAKEIQKAIKLWKEGASNKKNK